MAAPICNGGGWIVGMAYAIPSEPTEYYPEDGKTILGCNRLKCQRCGQWVRHIDQLYCKATVLGTDDAAQLFAATDPFAFRPRRARQGLARTCAAAASRRPRAPAPSSGSTTPTGAAPAIRN